MNATPILFIFKKKSVIVYRYNKIHTGKDY